MGAYRAHRIKSKCSKLSTLVTFPLFQKFNTADAVGDEEIHAKEFLDDLNTRLTENLAKQTVAEWNYESNITDENEKLQSDITAENAIFRKVHSLETAVLVYRQYS